MLSSNTNSAASFAASWRMRLEIAALDLHVAARERRGERDEAPAGLVHHREIPHVGLMLSNRVEHPHLAEDAQVRRPAEVHGVASCPQGGGALDHGGGEPATREPVGERGACDACAGDEDGAVRHGDLGGRLRTPYATGRVRRTHEHGHDGGVRHPTKGATAEDSRLEQLRSRAASRRPRALSQPDHLC